MVSRICRPSLFARRMLTLSFHDTFVFLCVRLAIRARTHAHTHRCVIHITRTQFECTTQFSRSPVIWNSRCDRIGKSGSFIPEIALVLSRPSCARQVRVARIYAHVCARTYVHARARICCIDFISINKRVRPSELAGKFL